MKRMTNTSTTMTPRETTFSKSIHRLYRVTTMGWLLIQRQLMLSCSSRPIPRWTRCTSRHRQLHQPRIFTVNRMKRVIKRLRCRISRPILPVQRKMDWFSNIGSRRRVLRKVYQVAKRSLPNLRMEWINQMVWQLSKNLQKVSTWTSKIILTL